MADGPNYEKVFLDKRLQPSVPDHQQKIVDYLRFFQSTDAYSDLYDHYAPLLAENGISISKVNHEEAVVVATEEIVSQAEAEEALEEAAGEDGVLTKTELNALKKEELVEIASKLGLDVEGNKPDYVEAILTHQA